MRRGAIEAFSSRSSALRGASGWPAALDVARDVLDDVVPVANEPFHAADPVAPPVPAPFVQVVLARQAEPGVVQEAHDVRRRALVSPGAAPLAFRSRYRHRTPLHGAVSRAWLASLDGSG